MTGYRTTLIALVALLLASPAMLRAQDADRETYDSAVFQLKRAKQVHRDGSHVMLLRALRHLADPSLAPLFSELVESPYTPFKIHGILGLAECDPDKKVDLARIAAIEDPAEQAQILSAAMDSELIDDDQIKQVLAWPGLDIAVKVLVASQLVSSGDFNQPELLNEAKTSDNIARRYLSYLLLAQIGDAESLKELETLHASTDRNRDEVRSMLLRTALRYDLDRIGPFAMHIAQEPNVSRRLRVEALKAALRFNTPGAENVFHQQYTSTTDLAHRTRLALMALQLSPWVGAPMFDVLVETDNDLISLLGRTGRAVASGENVPAAMSDLIAANYSQASAWALGYARFEADDAQATAIYKALIESYANGPERGRAQRLDDAVVATELYFKRDPDNAIPYLRGVIVGAADDPLLEQGILLGLLRTNEGEPHAVIEGMTFDEPEARDLALLLRARYSHGLPLADLNQLALMVRGGGRQRAPLRIQAGWIYLSTTNQTGPALAEVLGQ